MPIINNNIKYGTINKTVTASSVINPSTLSAVGATGSKMLTPESGKDGGLKGLLDGCELDIKVEAVECFTEGTGHFSQHLKLQEADKSKTLNDVSSFDIADLTQSMPLVLADKDVQDNLDYIATVLRDAKAINYAFNILKVSYKSPCDLAALSFTLDIADSFIVCPLGVYNTATGTAETSVAYDKMVSITPLSYNNSPVPVSTPTLCFLQKDPGSFCPASEDWSDFCYLIVVTVKPTHSLICLSGNFPASNIKGFKNEFMPSSLDLTQTSFFINASDGGGSLTGQQWFGLITIQMAFSIGWLSLTSQMPIQMKELAIANCDYDGDDDINAGDLLSIFRLFAAVATSGGEINAANLPSIVPKPCCGDQESEIPKDPVQKLSCSAEIEIINVQCFDGSIPTQVGYSDKAGVAGGGSTQLQLAGAGKSGSLYSTINPTIESGSGDDCADSGTSLGVNDAGSGSMVIDIALKNNTTVSGFQFDLGFNKFSTASQSKFNIQTNPSLSEIGWKTSSKVCDDRFGYDKLVRVMSYQALGVNYFAKGYNILDDEWYSMAQQVDSIQPNSTGMAVIRIVISDAPKTTCECPTKSYYIAGGLDKVKTLNNDQISNPDLYEVGTQWNGPVVQSGGRWWTANSSGGELIRDASSVPLIVEWDGIKVLNKRVVTNQDLHPPQHTSYGSLYYGHYSAFLAKVPESYDNLVNFYHSTLKKYVGKALHNGLDIGYNKSMSKYEYGWQYSYEAIVEYINAYQTSEELPVLTEEQKQEIKDGFLQKDYKGYVDDANLDGKFDVADIVALYNSARMRHYGLTYKAEDWRNPPTTNWDWAFVSSDNNYTSIINEMQHGEKYSFDDFPNFLRIVPTYCMNTICTSTMSDICPDICGNMDYETEKTLKENANAFSLIGFGERTDIMPKAGATLKLVFSSSPPVNSYFRLTDVEGESINLKFVNSGANGDALTGGYTAVLVGSNMSTALLNLRTVVNSSTIAITADAPSETYAPNDTILFTQDLDGQGGNKGVVYSDEIKTSLLQHTNTFVNGSNLLSELPHTFRSWAEYFFELYNITKDNLYKNETQYGEDGATFIPLELRVASTNKKLTEALSYVSFSWTTIDFCRAFEDSDTPKVKVLPGDGFTMCEVYDAETGARLTPFSTDPYKNFYQIPGHRKISILSHNFKTVGGVEKDSKNPSLENCDKFAPITMDGGKLITAKLFVTPMPKWSEGKYIEILDGHNSTLNEHMGSISTSWAPIQVAKEVADTNSGRLAVGPKTSEFSQNYAQDSASLLTKSDYMLHAQILNPRTILVKYNTMKPFKYASFSIRARNGSSEIESVTYPANSIYGDYSGWQFTHHFHQNGTANTEGLPYLPRNYDSDGYSVVTVSASKVFNNKYGISNPESFSGMGDLCVIKFKENICGDLPIFQKQYICPPIGTNNVKYPDRPVDNVADEQSKSIDSKYPEGSYEHDKYHNPTASAASQYLLANYASANNEDEKLKLDSQNLLDVWFPVSFGEELYPHNGDNAHRPLYSLGTGDVRKSLYFDQTKGMTTTGSPNYQTSLNKWAFYCVVRPEDTTLTRMTMFTAGGNGSTELKLALQLHKNSGNNYSIEAIISGNNSSGQQTVTTLASSAQATAFTNWHIFSWLGDLSSGQSSLYMDGELVALNQSLPQAKDLAAAPLGITVGHDGAHANITNSHSDSFDGRFGQLMMYGEVHKSDMRQKVEAYLATKYELQQNLPFEHLGYRHDTIGNGLSGMGYLALNKTDNLVTTAKKLDTQIDKSIFVYKQDLGSDRCAAAWVSKHICLDKDNQTLISTKCGDNTGLSFDDVSSDPPQNPGGGSGQYAPP